MGQQEKEQLCTLNWLAHISPPCGCRFKPGKQDSLYWSKAFGQEALAATHRALIPGPTLGIH